MTFAVRAATVADAPVMGEIHVAAWRAAYAGIMDADFLAGIDPVRGAEWWGRVLAGDSEPTGDGESRPEPWAHLVAERAGTVLAMVTVGPARESQPGVPEAELWMLNAHPDAFGTGAATILHGEAVAVMAGHRATAAYLWVARDNPRARRFYEREGWKADGTEKSEPLGGVDLAQVRYTRPL